MTTPVKRETLCVHGARDPHNRTGSLTVPIYQTATFEHPGVGQSTGFDYSRLQNPTRQQAEELVAQLEGGVEALACSSGMAAITLLMDLFAIGDHIVASDDLYGGSHRLFAATVAKRGIQLDYVDTREPVAVEAAIRPETRALFVETPSNPLMQVTDLRAMAELAQAKDLLLIVDNTFLTPYYQQPLALGADLVVHSGTKFLSGHNDTLSGFVVARDEELAERLRYIHKTTGAALAPFDSYLMIRGIKTLAIRMDRQQASALTIAHWLQAQPGIEAVHYVGLPAHPDYALSQQQATGFGSMLSFRVDTAERARRILERVQIIMYAESLGGVESLITYPMLQTHADLPPEERERKGIDETLLRLSVGIEHVADLQEDLAQALSCE